MIYVNLSIFPFVMPPKNIYIYPFECSLAYASDSSVVQCVAGTAVLVRRNTNVVRLRECSAKLKGCLTAK